MPAADETIINQLEIVDHSLHALSYIFKPGLRYKKAMIGEQSTFDDYYTALISETGTLAEQAKLEFETTELLSNNLENLRQSVSGVNLDEELANIVMFQHGYNASARVVSTMDKMIDTIINRMGV